MIVVDHFEVQNYSISILEYPIIYTTDQKFGA